MVEAAYDSLLAPLAGNCGILNEGNDLKTMVQFKRKYIRFTENAFYF